MQKHSGSFNRVMQAVAVFLCAGSFSQALAQASNPNVLARLQSRYALSIVANNEITPGSVITLQKEGLTGSPSFLFQNSYKEGRFKRGVLASMVATDGYRTFGAGEKFYIIKIDVKANNINFNLLTCGV